MYLYKFPSNRMRLRIMRVLLCGILVVTFTLDKVHCINDKPGDSSLGATGYTPPSGGDEESEEQRTTASPTGSNEDSEAFHYTPPPVSDEGSEVFQYTPPVRSGGYRGRNRHPSSPRTTGGFGPPPSYESIFSSAGYDYGGHVIPSSQAANALHYPPPPYSDFPVVDLTALPWSVQRGTVSRNPTSDEMCFQGLRPARTFGLFHFSAETTVRLPTYAGLLYSTVFTKGKCPSKPGLVIQTQYRWGWETVLKNHAISSDTSYIWNVPVYGQPLYRYNLMFAFATHSKRCEICFRTPQVYAYIDSTHMILSKPKHGEKNACRGQRHIVSGTIQLNVERWQSQHRTALIYDRGEEGFCITASEENYMEIETQTHAAELIRFLEGTVNLTSNKILRMSVRTTAPGTVVETYVQDLHPSREVALKAPVYACTNHEYNLLNITLRFEAKDIYMDTKVCFKNLRLPQAHAPP